MQTVVEAAMAAVGSSVFQNAHGSVSSLTFSCCGNYRLLFPMKAARDGAILKGGFMFALNCVVYYTIALEIVNRSFTTYCSPVTPRILRL